jgi:hypothetical protein
VAQPARLFAAKRKLAEQSQLKRATPEGAFWQNYKTN